MPRKPRKPKLSKKTIELLMNGQTVKKGKYEYEVGEEWNQGMGRLDETLIRWNGNEYEQWIIGWKGLYEFQVD